MLPPAQIILAQQRRKKNGPVAEASAVLLHLRTAEIGTFRPMFVSAAMAAIGSKPDIGPERPTRCE